MIGLDTNVIVRFLTKDEPAQFLMAQQELGRLTPQHPGFVTDVVLAELYWVLTRAYGLDKAQVLATIETLVNQAEIRVENHGRIERAIRAAHDGADLPDALIAEACRAAGAQDIITFDRKAATALGLRLLSAP
ncbi:MULTISPECIES: PIN domain-containing protein [Kocuria]|uniref:Ribonuclease VapC n=1 Tax=Kocuria subflava TaxID=1736139 RepID=A0A846TX77_9MICC|nr:type II toxin-antitoxin system VapC family toxin [Kocuria sp. CPCC 104605]NKE09827.1 type II toxin-antitoxin system VapC family toxin [Kocuria subflava]